MASKWKVSKWKSGIEKVECTKETDKSVWIKEKVWTMGDTPDSYVSNRYPRETRYDKYFDTWNEAYDYILDKTERRVEYIKRELKSAKGDLNTVLHSLIKDKPLD